MATQTLLSDAGIRCTRQRVEIYDALASTKAHPTAEELHQMVCGSSPSVSLATVYNTLEAFCRAGLARRLPSEGGGFRYDADMEDHLHFVATDGSVRDVPKELGEKLLRRISPEDIAELESRMGVRIEAVRLSFVGGGDDSAV